MEVQSEKMTEKVRNAWKKYNEKCMSCKYEWTDSTNLPCRDCTDDCDKFEQRETHETDNQQKIR